MRRIFCVLVLTITIKYLTPLPTSTHPSVGVAPIEIHNIEHVRIHNKSEEETTNHNLESKQIIEEDEYPVIMKKEADYDNNHFDLNQLRQKCLHLSKLLNLNKSPSRLSGYEEEYRPVYVTTQKPTTRPPTVTRPSSFYITVPPGGNRISIPAASSIRYIRLEPVILQKTILSNGRTVYYWHKSLPTAVEVPNKQESISRDDPYYNPFYNYYYNPNIYIPPVIKPTETTTEQITTTTTEESSFGYGLSHLIPFYNSGEITTTSTTELPTTISNKPDDLIYNQPFKFVVPVPYDENLRQNWGYNPYNYNPNFRVPYTPQLQIVKAVVVPKVDGKDDAEEEITK